MGVVGVFVGLLINIGITIFTGQPSTTLDLAVSAIGVLVFAGLTAYDTQRIKSMYFQVAGSDMMGKVVIMGALSLYLDFINMFQFLLAFMGDRR
jgi:FtsH-binding integral membrane protein